jgi:flagellar biosynthesis/type III secretory pathway chaperone
MNQHLAEKKLYYQQTITIWENFCQLHKELYDLTCEEYLTLLESDIESLEKMLPIKEEIIYKISELEKDRSDLINTLNTSTLFTSKISRAWDMLNAFSDIESESPIPVLKNLHALLIDIIQKIQEQNKKNQVFLNKAMISIREVKDGFTGKKQYTTYGANGQTRSLNR